MIHKTLPVSPVLRFPSLHVCRMRREEAGQSPWHYSFAQTPLGEVLLVSTSRGICFLGFTDDCRTGAMDRLKARFPHAVLQEGEEGYQQLLRQMWSPENEEEDMAHLPSVTLHLEATDFQWKVWNELLKIPVGNTVTYKEVAEAVRAPKAYRAVGSAVGENPVALLIPCHRVLRTDGGLGGYHWGIARKERLLEWERACLAGRPHAGMPVSVSDCRDASVGSGWNE